MRGCQHEKLFLAKYYPIKYLLELSFTQSLSDIQIDNNPSHYKVSITDPVPVGA